MCCLYYFVVETEAAVSASSAGGPKFSHSLQFGIQLLVVDYQVDLYAFVHSHIFLGVTFYIFSFLFLLLGESESNDCTSG